MTGRTAAEIPYRPAPLTAAQVLEAFAALTADMLAASERDDWFEVDALEAARGPLAEELPGALAALEPAAARALLEAVLAANHRITDRIRGVQTVAGATLGAFRHGSRGALTYLGVASTC